MSVSSVRLSLAKVADTVPNNEKQTTVGVLDVYKNPPGRSSFSLDAPWGEEPAPGHNGHKDVYSDAVFQEAGDVRHGLLKRLFDSLPTAANADKALVRENFAHAGEAHGHSPLLHKTAAPAIPTLTDQVRRVAGRR